MRELKIKVWVNNSEMIGPFDLSQNPTYWAHQLKDGERLLFTGLTDKNGVEIYEGDIIQFSNGRNKSVINFDNGCFVYYKSVFRSLYSDEKEIKAYCLMNITTDFEHHNDCEVIGNIFEKKNLSKGDHLSD